MFGINSPNSGFIHTSNTLTGAKISATKSGYDKVYYCSPISWQCELKAYKFGGCWFEAVNGEKPEYLIFLTDTDCIDKFTVFRLEDSEQTYPNGKTEYAFLGTSENGLGVCQFGHIELEWINGNIKNLGKRFTFDEVSSTLQDVILRMYKD